MGISQLSGYDQSYGSFLADMRAKKLELEECWKSLRMLNNYQLAKPLQKSVKRLKMLKHDMDQMMIFQQSLNCPMLVSLLNEIREKQLEVQDIMVDMQTMNSKLDVTLKNVSKTILLQKARQHAAQ